MNSISSVDKSDQRVRRMFSEIAPHYDRMNHLLSMNVDRYWRWRTVRKLKPQAGDRVLDVCTGTGDLAIAFDQYARRKLPERLEIIASDFCPEMLEIGRKKLDDDARITFEEADAQHLPYDDDQFGIVGVAFGLRNVADTARGLEEMVRVCRPGGQVAVLEFTTPRRWPVRPMYQWYFKNILPRIGQRLAKNTSGAYEYLPTSVGEFLEYEALCQAMQRAGLRDARFFPLTLGIATLYIGRK